MMSLLEYTAGAYADHTVDADDDLEDARDILLGRLPCVECGTINHPDNLWDGIGLCCREALK